MEDQTTIQPQEVTRDKNGRWITPPKGKPITRETARAMQEKRWAAARRAAAAALVERAQASKPQITSPVGVWALLNVNLYDKIMSSHLPRAEETMILGRNIGMLPAEWEKDQPAGESALESDLRGLIRAIADRIGVIPEQLRATNNEQNEDNG